MTTTTTEAVVNPTPEDTVAEDTERLSQEIVRLTGENQRLRDDWEAHRRRMGVRARQVGLEHDWCPVARNLVEELDGIWPDDEDVFTFTITATWRVRARLSSDADQNPESVTSAFLADSARVESVDMDDDWTSVEVLDSSHAIIGDWSRTSHKD